MYARRVTVQLKADSVASLTEKMENEVLPLLRKQEGLVGITLWESKEHADAYVKGAYPQVERILAPLVEGSAHVGGFNVVSSTFHKVGATVPETVSVPATVPV